MRIVPLLLLSVACSGGDRLVSHTGNLPAGAPSAPQPTAIPPALPEGAPVGADPILTAQVGKDVEAKNAAELRQGDSFTADGWTIVPLTDPPDAQLVAYSPTLAAQAPDALRIQLLSTTLRENDVDNVVQIAQTVTGDLRVASIMALGRSASPRAQAALLDLLTSPALAGDSESRNAIAPELRPRDLDDPNAVTMASLLDAPGLDDTDKGQLAFTLQLIAARDGMQVPTQSLSPAAQARLAAMQTLIAGDAQ